jgi:hypothetical protein
LVSIWYQRCIFTPARAFSAAAGQNKLCTGQKRLTQCLKAILTEHLNWHGARLSFLAHFLLTLIKVRRVNLAELTTGFGGKAQVASHYKRLQRFFRFFELDYTFLARLLVRLMPVGEER